MDPIEFLMSSQGKSRAEAEALWKKYSEDPILADKIKQAAQWKSEDNLRYMASKYGDLLFKPMSMKDRLAPGPAPVPIGNTLRSLAYPPIQPSVAPTIQNWSNLGNARPVPSSIPSYSTPGGTGGSDTADLGGQ